MSNALIYELADGEPIYYNGYKDVLNGKKPIEALIGSSFLQAILIARIVAWLHEHFSDKYLVMTSELGIQIDRNNWRLADIALLNKSLASKIKSQEKYINVAPDFIIEIDTKAAIDEGGQIGGLDYFQTKTDTLLNFGVKKLVWIFTQNRKILVAEKGKAWIIDNWDNLSLELEGKKLDLNSLIDDIYPIKQLSFFS
jgi:Uma2 family endonuclease